MDDEESVLRCILVPSHALVVLQEIIFVFVVVVVDYVCLAVGLLQTRHAFYNVAGFEFYQFEPTGIGALITGPSCRTPSDALRSVIASASQQIPIAHGRC